MNTEKLNYAMQYVDDDLLMEFFEMDDRSKAERTAALQRYLKIFVAAACAVLLVVLSGVTVYKRIKSGSKETTALITDIDLAGDPILLDQKKYQMFADSPSVREFLAENGYPADYGADTAGKKLGYLDMLADPRDGSLYFSFVEEETDHILYAYMNAEGDNFYILQSGEDYYLLIKDSMNN